MKSAYDTYIGGSLTENGVNPNNICEERGAKSNEHGHCHEEQSWAACDYERAVTVPEISEQNSKLISAYLLEPVFCASQSNASFTGNMRNKVQPTHASRI